MIIDSHVHVSEQTPDNGIFHFKLADGTDASMSVGKGVNLSVNQLLSDMDDCRVDKACVVAFPSIASNAFLSKVVKSHPKRLVGFAWIDNPRVHQSAKELEKTVKEMGLKGLKLHPGVQGFSPADPEIVPLIRRASELNVPIFIHMAPFQPHGDYYNCLVEHIYVLWKRVPEATILIGHMGLQRFLDLLPIGLMQSKIYVETSWGLTIMADLYGIDFATKFIRKYIGVDKVVFGSDWVGTNNERKAQLSIIQKMSLTREEKEKILGENIRKVLEVRA